MPRRSAPSRLNAIQALKDHPALVRILPSLPPRTLTRLYETVGIHDAGGLMAMTPPALLARAMDEAVWAEPGGHTAFDPDVFVDWLEVWLGEGEDFAAERLLALDEDFLALCFGSVAAVRDSSVDGFHRWAYDDGDLTDHGDARTVPDAVTVTIDRFVVTAAHEDEWDVIEPAVLALWNHAPETLLRLLERLTADDSRLEDETLHPGFIRDAAGARDQRRERAGFVPAAAARAFLAHAAIRSPAELAAMTEYDSETARHLSRLQAEAPGDAEAGESPKAGSDGPAGSATGSDATEAAGPDPTMSNEVWLLLQAAGVMDSAPPAGLLSGPDAATLPLERRLDGLAGSDPDALAQAASELAFLANVLLVIDVPATSSSPESACRELAFATANLGMELMEKRHDRPVRPGQPPGLIAAFLLGWRTVTDLPGQVVRAFEHALAAPSTDRYLAQRRWLRAQTEESLDDLAAAVRGRRFEAAREAVGLLSLAFDTDACRAVAHLLGQPARFPALLEGGGKDSARWIRTVADLEALAALLSALGPEG